MRAKNKVQNISKFESFDILRCRLEFELGIFMLESPRHVHNAKLIYACALKLGAVPEYIQLLATEEPRS